MAADPMRVAMQNFEFCIIELLLTMAVKKPQPYHDT